MTSNSANNKRKQSSSKKSTNNSQTRRRNVNSRSTNNANSRKRKVSTATSDENEFDLSMVLSVTLAFVLFIIMFVFSLDIFEGSFAVHLCNLFKGIFGVNALIIPIIGIATLIYALFSPMTKKKVFNIALIVISTFAIGTWSHLFAFKEISQSGFGEMLKIFYHEKKGGGALFGSIAYVIDKSCGRALIWIIALLILSASVILLFGKIIVSVAKYLIDKFNSLNDTNEDDEQNEDRRLEKKLTEREIRKMKQQIKTEEENKKKKPSNFKIANDTDDEMNESKIIDVNPSDVRAVQTNIFNDENDVPETDEKSVEKESNDIHVIDVKQSGKDVYYDEIKPINVYDDTPLTVSKPIIAKPSVAKPVEIIESKDENLISVTGSDDKSSDENLSALEVKPTLNAQNMLSSEENNKPPKTVQKKYVFPPINLLKKSEGRQKSGDNILEVSKKLKETLETFGVEVTIDPANCSKGPSVTRYELTPAPGVKVSRIVSLSDDIKLSLGATDIRIEAPIPGKSAVGIEVPNSESTAVPFRDLIESDDFRDAKSMITFAVGKDLAGKIVLADIAKMPHLLIAGATGSGKSVCINSIIMSILYKAHPDDVKMILIDPKVVELSVYNGIPHLLLPVVTDPKQASASLHWGVSEMEDRYKKFADAGVRDLKGYNEAADGDTVKKLPQIVIIVDELADLMMVAGKEVEESICRLAQLARAAGIHLIIATQRPSVDVITGLIKANMPSRIAFSVSSGIDSRTILDSNGAEKLLGKGDMLFFPQGLTKPSRVQGCFVSDKEVSDVVDFIKNQHITGYDERVVETVKTGNSSVCQVPGGDIDDLFSQAGSFIISKEKASIGALQRAFKIGFNRAARIMDQLEAKGVVGPEEGTKPRKILMTQDEFDELINSING